MARLSAADLLRRYAAGETNARPAMTASSAQPSLRELLIQLKASSDADTSSSDTTRTDALAEVNDLAQAAKNPAQDASLARRSINALQGLTAGIMATTKLAFDSSHLATAGKTLLPRIAGFFV